MSNTLIFFVIYCTAPQLNNSQNGTVGKSSGLQSRAVQVQIPGLLLNTRATLEMPRPGNPQ